MGERIILDCRMLLQSGKIYVGPVGGLKEGKGQNVGHDFVVFYSLYSVLSKATNSGVPLQ